MTLKATFLLLFLFSAARVEAQAISTVGREIAAPICISLDEPRAIGVSACSLECKSCGPYSSQRGGALPSQFRTCDATARVRAGYTHEVWTESVSRSRNPSTHIEYGEGVGVFGVRKVECASAPEGFREVALQRGRDPSRATQQNTVKISSSNLTGTGPYRIAEVTGFYSNPTPASIRGSVYLDSTADVTLVLKSWNGSAWSTVHSVHYPYTGNRTRFLEVEHTMAVTADVKFEVLTSRTSTDLYSVRLFGAQCFPDLSAPGACLN